MNQWNSSAGAAATPPHAFHLSLSLSLHCPSTAKRPCFLPPSDPLVVTARPRVSISKRDPQDRLLEPFLGLADSTSTLSLDLSFDRLLESRPCDSDQARTLDMRSTIVIKSATEYVVRVSFGTALIASIVIVYTTIIALLSSRSDEDNRGRRGGRSYDSGFTFYLSPSDLFWYWDPYYYRRQRIRKDNEGMNFIESVFSFVFGDGDPNQGIGEERWKLVIIEH